MLLRLFIFVVLLAVPNAAKADYFLWQHEKTGLSLTFPDTWKMANNVNPDTIATVVGPADGAQPICRIDARPDKRYTIFPARYGDSVQRVAVSEKFWREFLGQYDEYELGMMHDGSGLGRWFASFALASYNKHVGSVLQQRRSIMFASLYDDTLYIVECSALTHGYERWENDFRGIIKSVDFKKAFHELPTGEYANFLKDAEMYFWAQTGPEGTTAY